MPIDCQRRQINTGGAAQAQIRAFKQPGHKLPGTEDQRALVQQAASGDGFEIFKGQRWVCQELCEAVRLCFAARHLAHFGFGRRLPAAIEVPRCKIGVDQQPRLGGLARIEPRHHQCEGIATGAAGRRVGEVKDGHIHARCDEL